MASGIEELVNMLYDMISDAWGLPFGAEKCLLERDKVLDLIDEIRANLPKDLEQAGIIVENRNEIISQAKREAESIKRAAEEKARQMVAEDEIVVTSRQKSNEMVTAAENKAREIRRAANEYVDDTLKRLEEVMAQALSEMRNSRQQFKNVVNKNK
ncbi:MAG: hypothetical protein GX541_04690 [Clostridiales bacterium]|nr:hypothetical protein [Clostridiales bacterium]